MTGNPGIHRAAGEILFARRGAGTSPWEA